MRPGQLHQTVKINNNYPLIKIPQNRRVIGMSHVIRFDVRMYRNGDKEAAVEELLPVVNPLIHKLANKHRYEYPSIEDAEEIGKCALIEFLAVEYKLEDTADAWNVLRKVIRNAYDQNHRDYTKEKEHSLPSAVADAIFLARENSSDDTVDAVDEQAIRNTAISYVRYLVSKLSHNERRVYKLLYDEQLSYRAAGKRLHKYPSQIEWIDQSIRDKVRAAIVAEERKPYNN